MSTMPKSRRLSNSSQETFEEFCKENQPLSRRLSNGSDAASVGSITKPPREDKMEKGQRILLKKRRSISSVTGSNKRSQPVRSSRPSLPTGRVPIKPAGSLPPKTKRSQTTEPNKENGADDNENIVLSPTPYWKVAKERGDVHSPRETRAAKKRKTGRTLNFDTIDMPQREGLMMFSPPNQAANAERERIELERKTKER